MIFFFLQRKMVEMIHFGYRITYEYMQTEILLFIMCMHARSCSPNEASPRECGTE